MAVKTQNAYLGTSKRTNGSSNTWASNPNLINPSARSVNTLKNAGATAMSRANTYNAGSTAANSGLINKAVSKVKDLYGSQIAGKSGANAGNTGAGYSGYGSGGSGGGYGGDYGYGYASAAPAFDPTAALLAAIEAQKEAWRKQVEAANAALDKEAENARDRYASSKKIIGSDYQNLRNQASVQNFKAGRAQREALADRGGLNSGMGMQERLGLTANYNNNLNKINTQEQTAYDTLMNNLNAYIAKIGTQKAANLATTYSNAGNILSSLIGSAFSGYTPSQSYYDLANSLTSDVGSLANMASSSAAINPYDDLYRTY